MQNPGFGHILAVMAEVHARAGDIFTEVTILIVIMIIMNHDDSGGLKLHSVA